MHTQLVIMSEWFISESVNDQSVAGGKNNQELLISLH